VLAACCARLVEIVERVAQSGAGGGVDEVDDLVDDRVSASASSLDDEARGVVIMGGADEATGAEVRAWSLSRRR